LRREQDATVVVCTLLLLLLLLWLLLVCDETRRPLHRCGGGCGDRGPLLLL